MTNQEIINIAETIWSQLKATLGMPVIWSWGVSKRYYTTVQDMPALMLRVNGRLFKGYVLIALNEGADTYQIFVKKTQIGEEKCICDECYCDNFGAIIDRHIESGDNPEEYKKWCESTVGGLLE